MLNTLQSSCNCVVEVLATHSTTYCNYVFEKKTSSNIAFYNSSMSSTTVLQHNYNLVVAYLALVAMKVVFDEVFFSNT